MELGRCESCGLTYELKSGQVLLKNIKSIPLVSPELIKRIKEHGEYNLCDSCKKLLHVKEIE